MDTCAQSHSGCYAACNHYTSSPQSLVFGRASSECSASSGSRTLTRMKPAAKREQTGGIFYGFYLVLDSRLEHDELPMPNRLRTAPGSKDDRAR
jgi:hypothetical protein